MRLGVVADYVEEGWPSMDLCADMLLAHLPVSAGRLYPPFRRRFTRLPLLGGTGLARNADRLLNRFRDFPRYLRRHAGGFDLFHVVDHSYAQLVRELPAGRAGVYCHDLDAFRCLLEPDRDPRPRWFRAMARRILDGFRTAAVVFHNTRAVGEEVRRHGLVDPARLVHAPLGAAPEYTPEPRPDDPNEPPLPLDGRPFLLHVGSCIARKRIDVLLDAFAAARRGRPDLTLVQVGGAFTPPQREQLARLGIAGAVRQVCGVSRSQLAALYRRAAIVLQPSEAEGFGLPVLEALACGAAVVASDIPALREVGGDAVTYRPVGDAAGWAETIGRLLEHSGDAPARGERLVRAGLFSWEAHARTIAEGYRQLAGSAIPPLS